MDFSNFFHRFIHYSILFAKRKIYILPTLFCLKLSSINNITNAYFILLKTYIYNIKKTNSFKNGRGVNIIGSKFQLRVTHADPLMHKAIGENLH